MKVARLDAAALRVLAHPLRVRIVGSLRRDGPATATGLADRLGTSSGLASYHARVLADAGFVEPDPDRPAGGRSRWWRAAQEMTSWTAADARGDPDAEAAEQWLTGFVARTAGERIDRWLEQRPTADPAWVDAAENDDYAFELAPDELHAMLGEVNAVFQRWMTEPRPARDDRLSVEVILAAFPRLP